MDAETGLAETQAGDSEAEDEEQTGSTRAVHVLTRDEREDISDASSNAEDAICNSPQ